MQCEVKIVREIVDKSNQKARRLSQWPAPSRAGQAFRSTSSGPNYNPLFDEEGELVGLIDDDKFQPKKPSHITEFTDNYYPIGSWKETRTITIEETK